MGSIYSQGPLDVEEGGRREGQSDDMGQGLNPPLLVLMMEEEALSQGMQVATKSCKGQGHGFSPEPSGKNSTLLTP